MPELSTLTAAPRADVLPGYEFAQFTFAMFGMAEEELERRHVRNACLGAADATGDIQDKVLRLALEDVREGRLAYGSPAFDAHAKALSSLPILLWTCLRRKHPGMAPTDAESLITPENEREVYWAVMECMRYRRPEPGKKKAGTTEETSTSPEVGPNISPFSPSTESAPTK